MEIEKLYDRNIEKYEVIPTPEHIINEIPISRENQGKIIQYRQEIMDILDKKNNRKIIIVGPCSIHDIDYGIEYAKELKNISKKVEDEILIIIRTYFEKPRTCFGWSGLIYDPCLDDSGDIVKGIKTSRNFLSNISDIGLPCGTEFLGTMTPQYISDFISWAAIGARTTESHIHRQLASGLSMPVGFKNNTSGNIDVAIDATIAARHSHKFLGVSYNGENCVALTKGNKYTHVVLRGGNGKPNFDSELVNYTLNSQEKRGISKNVIIDCSHGNSNKKYELQEEVSYNVLEQIVSGNEDIIGISLESNIHEGSQTFPRNYQEIKELRKGVSITDSCISMETTKRIIYNYYEKLGKRKK
jgi:3-deoxy-7-phosphoheptulonate synthase